MKFLTLLFTLFATVTTQAAELSIEVFTSNATGFHTTSTLVKGESDAILIDAQFTRAAAHRLVAKIIESGKNLKTVFVTHAHPDHYFGIEVIKAAFPDVEFISTPQVVAEMKIHAPKDFEQWKGVYGNNLTDEPIIADEFSGKSLVLDGELLEIAEVRGTEIETTAIVKIPSLNTVVAGDLVYNGVHPWLAETDAQRRTNWKSVLTGLLTNADTRVIAGHKKPGAADELRAVRETLSYIQSFDQIISSQTSIEAAKSEMLKRFPDMSLPIILDYSLQAAYGQTDHQH